MPTVLTISIIILTAVFLTVGFWLILILRQVKKSFSKLDRILDKAEEATESVQQGFSILPRLAEELHDSAKAFGIVKLGLTTLLEFLDNKGVLSDRLVRKVRPGPASKKLSPPIKTKVEPEVEDSKEKTTKSSLHRKFFFRK